MKTAVALIRVSTADQQLGLAAQREDIVRYASEHGIDVLSWHSEIVSGGADIDQRPGLLASCEEIAKLRIDHLLVAKRDRLSRDPTTAMLAERALKTVKATVLCADGNNGMDPASELLRHILDGVARFERRMIGLRTKAALAALAASGKKLGRPMGSLDKTPRKNSKAAKAARTAALTSATTQTFHSPGSA